MFYRPADKRKCQRNSRVGTHSRVSPHGSALNYNAHLATLPACPSAAHSALPVQLPARREMSWEQIKLKINFFIYFLIHPRQDRFHGAFAKMAIDVTVASCW